MKIVFYPPVNSDNPKFVTFLLFVCTTALFIYIAQILSFENVSKRDAILAPVSKQWIAKDIFQLREPIKTRKNCYSLNWWILNNNIIPQVEVEAFNEPRIVEQNIHH